MAGVKGRSGRRPLSDEIRARELRLRTVDLAWKNTHKLLSQEHTPKEAIGIAGNIVVKDMVSKESVDSRQDIRMAISEEEKSILSNYIERNRIQQN